MFACVCGYVYMPPFERGPCKKKGQPDCIRVGTSSTNLLHKRRDVDILELPTQPRRQSYKGIDLTRVASKHILKEILKNPGQGLRNLFPHSIICQKTRMQCQF